mgnify:CR=1 FL=1
MSYSETRIVIGGLVHIPVLLFISNIFIGKFGLEKEGFIETVVKEEPVKVNKTKKT